MQLNQNFVNDILKLDIKGRIDSATCTDFEHQILSAVDAGHSKMVLDLADLDFISSSGLRVLLLTAKKLKMMNGQLVLTDMKEDVREVFDLTGFSSIFYIYQTWEIALTHFAA